MLIYLVYGVKLYLRHCNESQMLLGMELGMIGATLINAGMSFLGYWQIFKREPMNSDGEEEDYSYENTDLLKDSSMLSLLTTKFSIPEDTPIENKLETIKVNLQGLIKVKNTCDISGILTNN